MGSLIPNPLSPHGGICQSRPTSVRRVRPSLPAGQGLHSIDYLGNGPISASLHRRTLVAWYSLLSSVSVATDHNHGNRVHPVPLASGTAMTLLLCWPSSRFPRAHARAHRHIHAPCFAHSLA